jgi:mono/diheme cytochrome c family protein
MEVWIFLFPWIALGLAVFWVAFRGGPRRTAGRTVAGRGGAGVRIVTPLLYIVLGVSIPGAVMAARLNDTEGTRAVAAADQEAALGKRLFRQNCASCHTLAAVGARGITGPNLDRLGVVDERRVLNAIRVGGSGRGLMPANLLEGEEARAVAKFVAANAGRTQASE